MNSGQAGYRQKQELKKKKVKSYWGIFGNAHHKTYVRIPLSGSLWNQHWSTWVINLNSVPKTKAIELNKADIVYEK